MISTSGCQCQSRNSPGFDPSHSFHGVYSLSPGPGGVRGVDPEGDGPACHHHPHAREPHVRQARLLPGGLRVRIHVQGKGEIKGQLDSSVSEDKASSRRTHAQSKQIKEVIADVSLINFFILDSEGGRCHGRVTYQLYTCPRFATPLRLKHS